MEPQNPEQNICLQCGFCCDGTLFRQAHLKPNEYDSLPTLVKPLVINEKNVFKLPCPYHTGKCSIYNQKKPYVCDAFRCELLHDFSNNTISFERALTIVNQNRQLRSEIYLLYKQIFGTDYPNHFFQLLLDLADIYKLKSTGKFDDRKIDELIMKCGILDIALTKCFKPKKEFNEMIMK